jgi:hypothetical protein
MTCDIVALVRNQPDIRNVIDGMVAFGERVEPREVSGVTQLYDPAGRLLVSIEIPVLVQVSGEVAPPLWWVDIRAAVGLPDAERIARKFADDLVHWQGGSVWTGSVSATGEAAR